MKTKQVPQLDAAGFYVGDSIAYESPLEPGAFLIPGGAVDCEPPAVREGFRYRREADAWTEEPIPQAAPGEAA